MKKISFLLVIFLTTVMHLMAQADADTIIVRSNLDTDRISADLDSLVSSWYVKMALQNDPDIVSNDTAGIIYPDTVYRNRISKINSIVKLDFNGVIRNHIHVYTVKQREKSVAVLGLMDYYFPMIEDIFDKYGLPAELKYMAVIESALYPTAVNRYSGATGLWQFMYSTGRMYGLTINSIVDERRSPVKSTYAAARYLKDLYNIYQDWTLVIAAYNCGPGNVNKAIRRSGNKKNYWDIYYRLPRETRGYIPQFVAATYFINYYPEHNIRPLPLNIPVATDTIMVNKDIHLFQISEVMKIPYGELKALNPQYKTGLIPGSSKPQSLTLPITHLGDFIDLNDTIRRYKSDIYLNKTTQIADPSRSTYVPADVKGKAKLIYTVKEGDNLGYIAEWYRVPLSDIRYWNDIYRSTIRIGQKIVIYVDHSKSEYYSKVNGMNFAEKQAMTGKSVPSNTSTSTSAQTGPLVQTDGDYITHTVRYGDTIWDIVKLYDNVSTTEVLTLNNISDPGKIQVGQVLKIKKKS
ncbi:MAG: transglycosylase SLT domain-containing protein [Bacteroidales bacterium]|jgi:membrane-bound lytic murein transglycosylase D|nr:transglycosylase SLT domain-containing protein [Bacteroidales bacterium]